MEICVYVILYIFGILGQLIILKYGNIFVKMIPVLISCILFIFTKDENCFTLALYQVIILSLYIIVNQILKYVIRKKRKNEIEKIKLKDLS